MIARFTFGVFFFFAIVSAVSCGLHSRPLGSLCNDDQCSDIYCGSRAQCSNEKFIGNGDCVCRCLPGAVVANGNCNGNGEKNCWDCVAGTYAGGPPAYCGREWSGRYQNPEKSQCIYCPSGTYSNGERNIACSKCPAGTRANQEIGATGCDSCSAGRYSPAGSVQCTYCPRGTYSGERSGECIKCPAGTISDIFSPSIDSCIPCPLGTYSTGSECIPCSVGWYADMTGSSECKKCPAGTIPDTGVSVGATGCLGCPPGTVNPNEGATQCTSCTAGFYSDLAGLTSCLTCPTNSYNNQPASDSCKLCPIGEYSLALSGSTSCNKCGSSVEVASPFTSGPRCCRRDASLLNNGTDGTDTPSTGPSSVWMAGDYPSVFGSNHHIYINLANNIPPLIYKNGASVITFAQAKYRSYIVSPNFRYFVIFQEDGNICKYAGSGPSCTTGGLWCSYPPLVPPALGPNVRWIHHMQPDGNLCTYRINDDGTNTKAWCMDGVLAAGSYMEIQDDGRFCRKSASGIRLECV